MHHILKIYLGAENSVTAQFLDIKCDHTLQPNVAMSRGYGWRGGCPAADVPDAAVGSVEWFGGFFLLNCQ
jgi:hypothetical protein